MIDYYETFAREVTACASRGEFLPPVVKYESVDSKVAEVIRYVK